MGKPLMIQLEDDALIEKLKERMGAKTKIEVVRNALKLLQAELTRSDRIKRWEKSAKIIGKSGLADLSAFQTSERFNKLP